MGVRGRKNTKITRLHSLARKAGEDVFLRRQSHFHLSLQKCCQKQFILNVFHIFLLHYARSFIDKALIICPHCQRTFNPLNFQIFCVDWSLNVMNWSLTIAGNVFNLDVFLPLNFTMIHIILYTFAFIMKSLCLCGTMGKDFTNLLQFVIYCSFWNISTTKF